MAPYKESVRSQQGTGKNGQQNAHGKNLPRLTAAATRMRFTAQLRQLLFFGRTDVLSVWRSDLHDGLTARS
jgi:hypothetical protein